MINILIVDDSVVFRMAISEALKEVSDIKIIGTASNGKIAVDFFHKNSHPDLVILDMEMPVWDGVQTIEEIRKINKNCIIIVFSSLTQKGAEVTLKALSLGANDFVTKQEASSTTNLDESLKMIQATLVPKIKAFSKVLNKDVKILEKVALKITPQPQGLRRDYNLLEAPKLVVLASSTGGPDALTKVFKGIEIKPKIPMLIVQHMPPIFTQKLAEMLDKQCPYVEVREAKHGDQLIPGVCLIAPGDYHMTLSNKGLIELTQTEKVSFVRPSATVLFESIGNYYHGKSLSIVMTGMGNDGVAGLGKIIEKSNDVYVQNAKSSIVWGMPGAVKEKYPNIEELDLEEIPVLLNKVFSK